MGGSFYKKKSKKTIKWGVVNLVLATMPFRFVYLTADIPALSHSLDSAGEKVKGMLV